MQLTLKRSRKSSIDLNVDKQAPSAKAKTRVSDEDIQRINAAAANGSQGDSSSNKPAIVFGVVLVIVLIIPFLGWLFHH